MANATLRYQINSVGVAAASAISYETLRERSKIYG